MISFRYHVVSLLAVLLALAAGIALGSGPLQRSDDGDDGSGDAKALADARADAQRMEDELTYFDSYAAATSARLVGGVLTGRAVTVLALPGAEETAVDNVVAQVAEAGGRVTAQAEIGEELLDVANRQLVAELASQMQDSVKRAVRVPAAASGYERMGRLVAHALTSDKRAGEPVDGAGDSILAGLATADLLAVEGEVARRGSVVVLVAGAPYGSDDQREGAGSILGSLVVELDRASSGVVVTGPGSSAADDGLVGALRADPTVSGAVSTLDVSDRVAGAVVTVLALGRELDGASGHYGTPGAPDGAVPASGVDRGGR